MSLRVMPCLKTFVSSTTEGNRNNNLFKAINHVRFNNKTEDFTQLYAVGLGLNKCLRVPLSASEVRVITQHVLNQPYHSTCNHFKDHCKKCGVTYKKKAWRNQGEYWKVIDHKNRVILKDVIPHNVKMYLWDILDLDNLSDEQKEEVMISREKRGIDPYIDSIIKGYGVPVGEKAREEYLLYKMSD